MIKNVHQNKLLCVIAITFLFSCIMMPVQAHAAKKRMLWSSYDVGASGYIQASSIADALMKKYGTKVRLLPSGTSVGRLMPVITGQVDCGFLANEIHCAINGIYEFSTAEWGPQELRVVLAHPESVALMATKDSGVKTVWDIKGKRMAVTTSATNIIKREGYLAFANMTWNDVIRLDMPTYGEQCNSLKEGRADVTSASLTSSYAYDLENHPKGLQVVEMYPPDDKEAIARMQEVTPFMSIGFETKGAGVNTGKDKGGVWVPFYRYPMVTVRTDANADEVYELIKMLDETYDMYKDAYAPNESWAIQQSGIPPADAPYHEGAIRYLKEKGVWKAEHDAWNNQMIAHMKKVQSLWNEFQEKVDNMSADEKKKLKGDGFAKEWLSFREQGLKKK